MSIDFYAAAQALAPETIARRRDFHRHPELGFQEVRTAGVVAETLQRLGLEVRTGVGRTGVVGLLEGDRPGPTLLLRFDMDALPIDEANAVDYASQTPGVMHACGHDGHTSIGLTVAQLLAAQRGRLAGTLKFVFQPAEEGLGGAAAMIQDGVLADPAPERSLALHLWNEKPLGWVAASDGPAMAAAGKFSVHLRGKGGHGAAPHQAHDPVVAAAHIITALQTVVARSVAPLDTAVLSVTSVQAGTAFNIIPDSAALLGTVRTFRPEVEAVVMRRMEQIIHKLAEALECQASLAWDRTCPATVNDPEMAARVRALAADLPGVTQISADERTTGSEDMAFMMQTIPGCYFFVGSANSVQGLDFPHHHPRFDFDERALALGAALMARAAASYVLPD